jgi:hypothetical protein
MPIPITCPSCNGKLKAPENLAGRKVKCPKCSQAIPVPAAAPVAAAIEIEEEPEVDRDEGDEAPAKRKKKKKKKKKAAKSDTTIILVAGGISTIIMLGVLGLLVWTFSENLMYYAVGLAVSVPFSLGFLILSMVISSSIAGGIDFGDAKTAIFKALILMTVHDVVMFVPFAGPYLLSWLVMIVGLMVLYGLDFWETRFLIFINWVLHVIFFLFVFTMLMKMFGVPYIPGGMGGSHDKDDEEVLVSHWTYGDIEDRKGAIGVNQQGVFFIDLNGHRGCHIKNGHLECLDKFYEKCQELDVSNNPITDRGILKFIPNFVNLKTLIVTGTKVTPDGIAKLQKKMPNLKIIQEQSGSKGDKKGGQDKKDADDDGS